MAKLITIGYEGATPEDFIATLHEAGVKTLIDIREIAVSRRKGFSKTILSTSLEASGISYVHLRGLGDPKEGREAARQGNYTEFLRVFNAHLKTVKARSDLERAAAIAVGTQACLLCYERNPEHCHRKLVAMELSVIVDLDVQHIGVREGLASSGSALRQGRSANPRESTAANR